MSARDFFICLFIFGIHTGLLLTFADVTDTDAESLTNATTDASTNSSVSSEPQSTNSPNNITTDSNNQTVITAISASPSLSSTTDISSVPPSTDVSTQSTPSPKTTTTSTTITTTTEPATATLKVPPEAKESFFGEHGLLVFIVTLAVAVLLLYAVIMLLCLPKILKAVRSRRNAKGKYYMQKSNDHSAAPFRIPFDDDTHTSSKAPDPAPLMLVTALDSEYLDNQGNVSDQNINEQLLASAKEDHRKGSSDEANVSTFLLRKKSLLEEKEKKEAESRYAPQPAEQQYPPPPPPPEDTSSTVSV